MSTQPQSRCPPLPASEAVSDAPRAALLVFLQPGRPSGAFDRIVTNARSIAVRSARVSRILLGVPLLLSMTGKVLAADRVLDLAIHDEQSSAKPPPVFSVLQNDRVVIRL